MTLFFLCIYLHAFSFTFILSVDISLPWLVLSKYIEASFWNFSGSKIFETTGVLMKFTSEEVQPFLIHELKAISDPS